MSIASPKTDHMASLDPAPEVITREELMRRLRIKRSSFYNLIGTGRLVRGRHFVEVCGRYHIFWSAQLLVDLDDQKTRKKPKTGINTGNNKPFINFNY